MHVEAMLVEPSFDALCDMGIVRIRELVYSTGRQSESALSSTHVESYIVQMSTYNSSLTEVAHHLHCLELEVELSWRSRSVSTGPHGNEDPSLSLFAAHHGSRGMIDVQVIRA